MGLPKNKTKIVCTIACFRYTGNDAAPCCAGMNVARLNFSHGDFAGHKKVIENLRAAAREVNRRVTIMADLPGPKIRIGKLAKEPIDLAKGIRLRSPPMISLATSGVSLVPFAPLTSAVTAGDVIFLNDGLIELTVVSVDGSDVHCEVLVGGELRSRKGLNFPGINLGISAFTDFDHHCLRFAAAQKIDAVSQSFVENAADIAAVRKSSRRI